MSHHNEPGPPCSHMKSMLNEAADGRARGLRLWYALAHAAKCGRCGRYLACLKEMVSILRGRREEMPSDVEERLLGKVVEAAEGRKQ